MRSSVQGLLVAAVLMCGLGAPALAAGVALAPSSEPAPCYQACHAEIADPSQPGTSELTAQACLERCERSNVWCLQHVETGCELQACALTCS